MIAYAGQLCTLPWRLPTSDDVWTLSNATTAENVKMAWGLAGAANGSSIVNVETNGYIWSTNELSSDYANNVNYDNYSLRVYYTYKCMGFALRCIR